MSSAPANITETAAALVDWSDRASTWLQHNREIWEDDPSDDDKEFDQVTISFDRTDLNAFMRDLELVRQNLRLVHAFVAEKEASA